MQEGGNIGLISAYATHSNRILYSSITYFKNRRTQNAGCSLTYKTEETENSHSCSNIDELKQKPLIRW